MRQHRFYIQTNLEVGKEVTIDETTHLHQWLSVFRYTTGDTVILFNGNGSDYEAIFLELHKKKAVLKVEGAEVSMMPQKELHLFLAMIKKDLFELAVEKATELGVSSITPIITERTQNKNINIDRLRKISIEASEQSGRGTVPHITESVSLENALEYASRYTILFAQIGGQETIKISSSNPQALFIGPEGGWGEKDYELLKKYQEKYQIETISFGETVLRAETAAIVGSFMLLK